MIDHGFFPDAARMAALDARRHSDLASSLAHLAEVTAGSPLSRGLAACSEAITQGTRIPAEGFGSYFRIATALLEGDAEAAARASGPLLALRPRPAPFTLLTEGGLAAKPLAEALTASTEGDSSLADRVPADAKTIARFTANFAKALEILEQHLPSLHAELSAQIFQILLAAPAPGAKIIFDGASHYQLWGFLILNPEAHETPLQIVEALAHEAGHGLLFGMTIDEPLVLNPDTDLFPSPLRTDPRPMDGIYHATFVSARMAWAMETLAAALPKGPDRDHALKAAAEDRANFASGISVIDEHARLTPTGSAIIESARAFVRQPV
ncbi:HEXXH motif domain-containing protein [Alphaproteobacteria bacterium KMM 3653]|uniref:HEXXH motif domain-containing protein n=1 Tax=Harenicola maris TaxID=2841044 RepID=A0AAP2CRM4_9RHOB|nr:HEXXH motif domain-containing protein [Harenicola maris]